MTKELNLGPQQDNLQSEQNGKLEKVKKHERKN